MLGYTGTESLVFDNGLSCKTKALNSIVETLNYLCHAYYNFQNWSFISASFTHYLIELILLKVPNNYSHQLNECRQEVIPSYMRKAQQYIQEHLQSQISLAELSVFCGVSSRTLQKSFNQYCQQTPLEYIRDQRLQGVHHALLNSQFSDTVTDILYQRLQGVHHALLNSQFSDTVTDILFQNGIQSLGRFSSRYKKRYGCLP